VRHVHILTAALLAAMLAVPAAASAGQGSIRVPDPAGGTPWTAAVGKVGSRTCVTVRRGADRKPRECARLSASRSLSRVFLYSVRVDTAPDPRDSRTIAVAVFGNAVARARLQSPDGVVTFRRGRRRGPGILLAVMAGRVERPTLRVDVRTRRGLQRLRNAPPEGLEVADPQGGAAWKAVALAASGERACVRWERIPGRFDVPPSPLRGPLTCGPGNDRIPVAVAQRADGRIVVTGIAGADSGSLQLLVSGQPQPMSLDRRSRAFLAILPASVDTNALVVRSRPSQNTTVDRRVALVG
jgi:hypothetical protein